MNLPAIGYISNANRTTGEEKQAFEDLRDAIAALPGAAAEGTLTIAAGVITPGAEAAGRMVGVYSVDTELAAPSDDLTNISQTNAHDGTILYLRCKSAARPVTVKHSAGGIGQISLTGGQDFLLGAVSTWLILKRSSTLWEEIGRHTQAVSFALIGGNNSFAVGTRQLFDQDTPPTGWTRDATINDRVVNIQGSGARVHAGSWTITGLTHAHTHSQQGTFTTGNPSNTQAEGVAGNNAAHALHTHQVTISGQTGGASTTAVTHAPGWRPFHRSMIMAEK